MAGNLHGRDHNTCCHLVGHAATKQARLLPFSNSAMSTSAPERFANINIGLLGGELL